MVNIHDILNNIVFKYLSFYDKHVFKKINKYNDNIKIVNLFDIGHIYLMKLDDSILTHYSHVVKLGASHNCKISNVNHMKKIKHLNARGTCSINVNGIKNINLEVLDASYNPKITDVNHMVDLRDLTACRSCGICDRGIKNVNLEILLSCHNSKISNVNHMTNLKLWCIDELCNADDVHSRSYNYVKLNDPNDLKVNKKQKTDR